MKRILTFFLATMIVATVSYWAVRLHAYQVKFSAKQPFTAYIQRSSRNLKTGNSFLGHAVYAIRSDGSKVEANLDDYPKMTNAVRGISLVNEKKYVVVSDRAESISTNYLSDTAVSRLRMKSSNST